MLLFCFHLCLLYTTLVSCPDPTFSQEKMFKTFCTPPTQNMFGYLSREGTATEEVVCNIIPSNSLSLLLLLTAF